VANFFISKYLKHILSAWNGFRSTRLEFSISKTEMDIPQPIWIFFCALNFSLDAHLLIPVTNKSCRHSPKLFARKIFLSIFHVRLIVAKLNFAASLANLGLAFCLRAFVVKLICQWPGPISKWSSTRVADQVAKVKEGKCAYGTEVKMLPGLLTICQA